MLYATLAQAKVELKATVTTDDAVIKQMLRFVTARINQVKAPIEYMPRREIRRFDALGNHIVDAGFTLLLGDDPFLALVEVEDGEGTTLTAYDRSTDTGDYILAGRTTPYYQISLAENGGKNWYAYTGSVQQAIAIDAYWGFRRRYNEAWLTSNDTVQNNPLTSSATSITVNDADGQDSEGLTPRFSYGQLLKIESEFLEVVDVNTATNVLTVNRGVRGTTAAAHVQNTAISIFAPEPTVTRAALRWANYLYARRGSFEQTRYDGIATVTFPSDMPGEIKAILDELPESDWAAV